MKALLVLWTFLAIWIQTFATQPDPHINPIDENQTQETLEKFLKRTYKTVRTRTKSDVGEPLILTKYIDENRLEEAREAASVDAEALQTHLESYAGYFTVNKAYNSNLWMWYFPAVEDSVEEAPLIIWLQGGPGASSLYGLFTEIGPYNVSEDGILGDMEYSWGLRHSLLFIDNPVGTGFSFTDDDRGYATNQTMIGEQLYDALQQFLTIFPELRKAPLTIAGESYAGKHIPSLAIQIHRNQQNNCPINLHGLAIGNGFIDPESLQRYSYFVREVGLVDDKVADIMQAYEVKVQQSMVKKQPVQAFRYYNSLLGIFLQESRLGNLYNYLDDEIGLDGEYMDFIERDDIRRALHVGNTNFTSIGTVYKKLIPDFMNSAKLWLEELIQNYKVMCYNGHLDIIVAYHPSVNTYHSLRFPGSELLKTMRRSPWYHSNKLVGWYKSVGNFSDVMVRGAGHMVPADKPAAALGLISAFARGITLEEDTALAIGNTKKSLKSH